MPSRRNRLTALNRVIAAAGRSSDVTHLLHEAAFTAVEILGAAGCRLSLYDAASDYLTLAADYGLPEALKAPCASRPVAGSPAEHPIRQMQAIQLSLNSGPAIAAPELSSVPNDWRRYVCVPLAARRKVEGVMEIFSRRARPFNRHEMLLFQTLAAQIGLVIGHARLHETIQRLALTDALTGAYNRRYLDDCLLKELQRGTRYQRGLSLILLDVDYFKEYNDEHGHLAGDEALRQVVRVLRQNVRAVDVVARYGGEEFAVVLPETPAPGAYAAAEKLRAAIQAHAFPQGRLTASLGVAHCVYIADPQPEAIIAMADQALYRAKRNGRNCVQMWAAEQPSSSDAPHYRPIDRLRQTYTNTATMAIAAIYHSANPPSGAD